MAERTLATGELEEDPDEVARGYKVLLDQLGRKLRDVGLKVNLRRSPTLEELKQSLLPPPVSERLAPSNRDEHETRRPGYSDDARPGAAAACNAL
jgi:hypothetical protein